MPDLPLVKCGQRCGRHDDTKSIEIALQIANLDLADSRTRKQYKQSGIFTNTTGTRLGVDRNKFLSFITPR